MPVYSHRDHAGNWKTHSGYLVVELARQTRAYTNFARDQAVATGFQVGLRLISEVLQHGMSIAARQIDGWMAEDEKGPDLHQLDELIVRPVLGEDLETALKGRTLTQWLEQKPSLMPGGQSRGKVIADQIANVIEFATFRVITVRGEHAVRKIIAEDAEMALAAEMGAPGIDFWEHQRESRNPIIRCHAAQIESDEKLRLVCDSLFLLNIPIMGAYLLYRMCTNAPEQAAQGANGEHSWVQDALEFASNINIALVAGVVAKGVQFFNERLKLTDDNPYELIAKNVGNVGSMELGEMARPRLKFSLAQAMQAARRDCDIEGMGMWSNTQMAALEPALERLIDGMIERVESPYGMRDADGKRTKPKFGVAEAIYACGVLLDGNDPEGSLANVERLHQVGLAGFARAEQATAVVPAAQTVEAVEESITATPAPSARTPSLTPEQLNILSQAMPKVTLGAPRGELDLDVALHQRYAGDGRTARSV